MMQHTFTPNETRQRPLRLKDIPASAFAVLTEDIEEWGWWVGQLLYCDPSGQTISNLTVGRYVRKTEIELNRNATVKELQNGKIEIEV